MPDAEYRDLIADHFQTANESEGAVFFTEAEVDCVAAAIVEGLGTAALGDLGYDTASGSVPNPNALGPALSIVDRGGGSPVSRRVSTYRGS